LIAANRAPQDAIYKGLAIAEVGPQGSGQHRIYATDFHNNRVDMFDGTFTLLQRPGAFVDATLPGRFAPFGIQTIAGRVYVTYAMQDEMAHDDVHGPGLGFVNVFDTDGNRIARVASRGRLNAPWGLAWSPGDFGPRSNALLIGNFGDGRINTYRP